MEHLYEARILLVDDNPDILEMLKNILARRGFQNVRTASDCRSARLAFDEYAPQMVILDIMLPDGDGFSLMRDFRLACDSPVLFLSAKDEDNDRLLGLGLGADDYITKPFNPLEVVARVKTQLRRYRNYNMLAEKKPAGTEEYDIRGLCINRHTHKCFLYGKELSLTPTEFSILWYLCEHQGTVVPSEELFEAVWGEKYLHNNNTVMAHIGRLREKMNDSAKKAKFIVNRWGVGYIIES